MSQYYCLYLCWCHFSPSFLFLLTNTVATLSSTQVLWCTVLTSKVGLWHKQFCYLGMPFPTFIHRAEGCMLYLQHSKVFSGIWFYPNTWVSDSDCVIRRGDLKWGALRFVYHTYVGIGASPVARAEKPASYKKHKVQKVKTVSVAQENHRFFKTNIYLFRLGQLLVVARGI